MQPQGNYERAAVTREHCVPKNHVGSRDCQRENGTKQVKQGRKPLKLPLSNGKRPELSLSPTPLKPKEEEFFRVRGKTQPSVFAKWLSPKEK